LRTDQINADSTVRLAVPGTSHLGGRLEPTSGAEMSEEERFYDLHNYKFIDSLLVYRIFDAFWRRFNSYAAFIGRHHICVRPVSGSAHCRLDVNLIS